MSEVASTGKSATARQFHCQGNSNFPGIHLDSPRVAQVLIWIEILFS